MKTSWTFFEFPYRRQSTHAHALTRSRYFYLHMLVRDTHGINLALPPNPRYCHRQMLVHDMMVSPTYLAPPPRPCRTTVDCYLQMLVHEIRWYQYPLAWPHALPRPHHRYLQMHVRHLVSSSSASQVGGCLNHVLEAPRSKKV